jgi:ubiquinol-cytochrome c reductase cytochrome c1 subunit
LAATAASAGSIAFYTHAYGVPFLPEASANTAAEDGLHPTSYPFEHKGMFETFDHSSIRRGYQGEADQKQNEGRIAADNK